MEYSLAIDGAPSSIDGGTGILLLHPSTGETDRIDTNFLKTDTDRFLVISTRTTAREVQQKLEHYGVDEDRADILDTLSVERGYSRRSADNIHYVSSPDDLDGIIEVTERFLSETDGKRRISVDSITEMAYYADEERTLSAVERLLELLDEHDAVGLFHLAPEVHEEAIVAEYESLFDGVIELGEDDTIEIRF
ncbi:MAG: ATPase domain-containing protein [Halobacteriales archaeon]|nr:ATPase domain-containing protein [Halobacteriales archaeon]